MRGKLTLSNFQLQREKWNIFRNLQEVQLPSSKHWGTESTVRHSSWELLMVLWCPQQLSPEVYILSSMPGHWLWSFTGGPFRTASESLSATHRPITLSRGQASKIMEGIHSYTMEKVLWGQSLCKLLCVACCICRGYSESAALFSFLTSSHLL